MKKKPFSNNSIAVILAFFAIYFIWGTTYLASIIGLEGLKPFVLSSLRYLAAALLLGAYLVFSGKFRLQRGSLPVLFISGSLMLVGGSGLVVYGEQYVNSGYAAVIVATEPLWFVLLDKKRWKFYLGNRVVVLGLIIGFAGILLFAWLSPAEAALKPGGIIQGTCILLISAVLWVTGSLYANKKLPAGGSNVTHTAVQLFSGGLVSAVLALVFGEWNVFDPVAVTANVWYALLFLIIFGSLIAYVAYNWLLTVRPPAIVSTHTYVNPVVAIVTGAAFGGEKISGQQVVALCVVVIAVIVTQLGKDKTLVKAGIETPA